jgi:AcrR family transcriptional regulator
MDEQKSNRRRGEVLESAILQAAWEEFSDLGYAHLTMESVAARAKTNKAVLYRRWSNKAELIRAALHIYLPKPMTVIPDTGNLRNDVVLYLRGLAEPLQIVGADAIHALIGELLNKSLISAIPPILQPGTESKLGAAMLTILKNAEKRGEINLAQMSPRIISLPLDLFRYEVLSRHEPVSDKTITEIVDVIFMPLLK